MMLAYFICLHLPVQSIWLQRFPSFLLGMSFGKLILECNTSENIRTISWLYVVGGCILLCVLAYIEPLVPELQMKVIFFFCVPLILISTGLFLQLTNVSVVSRCLKFIGRITLELYIVHELVCLPIVRLFTPVNGFVIPVSILIAIAISYSMSRISSIINAKIGL